MFIRAVIATITNQMWIVEYSQTMIKVEWHAAGVVYYSEVAQDWPLANGQIYTGVDLQNRPFNEKQRPAALTNKKQDIVI